MTNQNLTDRLNAGPLAQQVITSTASIGYTGSWTEVTSISIPAGVWSISSVVYFNGTAATSIGNYIATSPNTASGGVNGQTLINGACNSGAGVGSATIPQYTVSLSATTTYYLNSVSVGATAGNILGTLTAIRIG